MDSPVYLSVILICLLLLFFMPSIKAYRKDNFADVLLLNIFLGWTVYGWVLAYILSTEE